MIRLSDNEIILFQGDSITHGGRGLNPDDHNHVLGHGYQALVAGRIAFDSLPARPAFFNRGVSGDNTSKMLARWEADAIALRPTLLSILIGVNNAYSPRNENEPALYKKELCAALDRTRGALPRCRIVLCEPFAFLPPAAPPLPDPPEILRTRAIARIVRQIAADYGACFVPLWDALDAYVKSCAPGMIIWDGVHPTFLGHEIIARQWYAAVEKAGIL